MKVLPLLLICLVSDLSTSQNTFKRTRKNPIITPSGINIGFIEPIIRSLFTNREPSRVRLRKLRRPPISQGRINPSVAQTSGVQVRPEIFIEKDESHHSQLPQNVWIFPNLRPFSAQGLQPLRYLTSPSLPLPPPPRPPSPMIPSETKAHSFSSFKKDGFGKPKFHSIIQMGQKKHLIKNQITDVIPDLHLSSGTSSSKIQRAITILKPKPLKVMSKSVIKLAPPPSTLIAPNKPLTTTFGLHPPKIKKPLVPHQQITEEDLPFILRPIPPPKLTHSKNHQFLQNAEQSDSKVPGKHLKHSFHHDLSHNEKHPNLKVPEPNEEHSHHSSQNVQFFNFNIPKVNDEQIFHENSFHTEDNISNKDTKSHEEHLSFEQPLHVIEHSDNKDQNPHEEQISHPNFSQDIGHFEDFQNVNHFDMDELNDFISSQVEDDKHNLNQLNSVPEKDVVDVSFVHEILKNISGYTTVPVPDVNAGILPLANEFPHIEYHNYPPFTQLLT